MWIGSICCVLLEPEIIGKSSDYINKIQWDTYLTLEASKELMFNSKTISYSGINSIVNFFNKLVTFLKFPYKVCVIFIYLSNISFNHKFYLLIQSFLEHKCPKHTFPYIIYSYSRDNTIKRTN